MENKIQKVEMSSLEKKTKQSELTEQINILLDANLGKPIWRFDKIRKRAIEAVVGKIIAGQEAYDEQIEEAIPSFTAGRISYKGKKHIGIIIITSRAIYFEGFSEKLIQLKKLITRRGESESETERISRRLIDGYTLEQKGSFSIVEISYKKAVKEQLIGNKSKFHFWVAPDQKTKCDHSLEKISIENTELHRAWEALQEHGIEINVEVGVDAYKETLNVLAEDRNIAQEKLKLERFDEAEQREIERTIKTNKRNKFKLESASELERHQAEESLKMTTLSEKEREISLNNKDKENDMKVKQMEAAAKLIHGENKTIIREGSYDELRKNDQQRRSDIKGILAAAGLTGLISSDDDDIDLIEKKEEDEE